MERGGLPVPISTCPGVSPTPSTVQAAEYETLWLPVLNALHAGGELHAPVRLARLLILGALNWSVQWFDPKKGASLQELTDAAMALFLKEC